MSAFIQMVGGPTPTQSIHVRFLFEGRDWLHSLLVPIPADVLLLAQRYPHSRLEIVLDSDSRSAFPLLPVDVEAREGRRP